MCGTEKIKQGLLLGNEKEKIELVTVKDKNMERGSDYSNPRAWHDWVGKIINE